jgi:hypothetical protein
MTLNEFTSELAARYGKELDMQYRQWLVPQIGQWRSRLIRNTIEKNPQDKSQFLQSIKVPLTYGDYVCGDIDCKGSFSEELPKLVRIGSTPFEYVGSIDGKSPYRYNDMGTEDYINQGMTAHLFLGYRVDNNTIVIPDHRIKEVKATGIFDEPEKAMEWQCRTENIGCDWWNADYPITGDIASLVKTAIWNELDPTRGEDPKRADQDE